MLKKVLYYSINDLIKECDIENLIKDYSNEEVSYYKTDLWSENNEKYGELFIELELKYISSITYYTHGKIKILLKDNIYIEGNCEKEGCKMDYLTDKFNIKSNIYMKDKQIINESIIINLDYFINNNNSHGVILLN